MFHVCSVARRYPLFACATDLLHGMIIGAAALALAVPFQFWKVKYSLIGNCVLVAAGSLCTYIGLLEDQPDMAWLMAGRVLSIVGGEAGFILLLIQVSCLHVHLRCLGGAFNLDTDVLCWLDRLTWCGAHGHLSRSVWALWLGSPPLFSSWPTCRRGW